jgi:hypothetical protein
MKNSLRARLYIPVQVVKEGNGHEIEIEMSSEKKDTM